jgi:hypothetical protein
MYSSITNYTFFSNDNNENFSEPILNLIIFNENSEHECKMKDILDRYLRTIPDVIYYFITLKEQEQDILIKDHVMYFKGTESVVPGCLDKTLRAIEYCNKQMSFRYIIRSNISTVIDFSRQNEDNNYEYGGCTILNLQWLDSYSGIYDVNLFGTMFSQGTYIYLSKTAIEYLLKNIDKVDKTIVDDVSLGKFFTNVFTLKKAGITTENNNNINGSLCYRNKTKNNRMEDVERMKIIVNNLIQK